MQHPTTSTTASFCFCMFAPRPIWTPRPGIPSPHRCRPAVGPRSHGRPSPSATRSNALELTADISSPSPLQELGFWDGLTKSRASGWRVSLSRGAERCASRTVPSGDAALGICQHHAASRGGVRGKWHVARTTPSDPTLSLSSRVALPQRRSSCMLLPRLFRRGCRQNADRARGKNVLQLHSRSLLSLQGLKRDRPPCAAVSGMHAHNPHPIGRPRWIMRGRRALKVRAAQAVYRTGGALRAASRRASLQMRRAGHQAPQAPRCVKGRGLA
eukprot:360675-Chlamydomonas_euryale.AAC.13